MSINRLKDKIVLITGASSGIGRATAAAFAEKGATLILVARRAEMLNQLKEDLSRDFGIEIHTSVADVRDRVQVDAFFAAFPDKFKRIDILVNNAGLALGLGHTVTSSIDDWAAMLDTNVKGLLYVTKAVLTLMYEHESGHIINLGSTAGIYHYANASVYCATKAAVHAFSNSLREECVEKNIKVSEVLPGMVSNTEFSKVRFNGDSDRADNVYKGVEPLVPEDIADLILYTANLPERINLAQSVIMPIAQANSHKIHRK